MTKQQKKGLSKARLQVGDILPLALTLVVAGMGVAFGLNIVNDLKDKTLCSGTDTYNVSADKCQSATNASTDTSTAALNATKDTVLGVAKFSSKFGIIATVVVAAIVIGLLVRFLGSRV